jgi:hypothetical protein
VKVWICRGLIYGKKDLFQSTVDTKEKSAPARRMSRGGDYSGQRRRKSNQ